MLDQTLAIVDETPACIRGMLSALGWLPKEKLQGYVVNRLKSNEPLLRQIGLGACAIQRVDCGGYLILGLQDFNTVIRARALRSIGELRRQVLLPFLSEQLKTGDMSCRFWAAWSATMLGDSEGLLVLRSFFEMESEFRQFSILLELRAMG